MSNINQEKNEFFAGTGDTVLRFTVENSTSLGVDVLSKSKRGKGLKYIPACHIELTASATEALIEQLRQSLQQMKENELHDVSMSIYNRMLKAEAEKKERHENKLIENILNKQGRKCIICGKHIEGNSHDAFPYAVGRCCLVCNNTKVADLRRRGKFIKFNEVVPGNVLELTTQKDGKFAGQVRSIISKTPTEVVFRYLIKTGQHRSLANLRTGSYSPDQDVFKIQ